VRILDKKIGVRGGDRVAALETAASFASERDGCAGRGVRSVVNAAEEQGVKTAARTRRAAVPIALVREVDTSWGVLERGDEHRGRR
jgi:hypothetical protein